MFADRRSEADEFYAHVIHRELSDADRHIARRAYAGLLWGKQLYRYDVNAWMEGDPNSPPVADYRKYVRNEHWRQMALADVISMPDEWEYPWFAAWDLAFHVIPLAHVDPAFAKEQLVLMCREWAMHPNGQLPAYEWEFGDVNPPVHAWAAWHVYRIDGYRDREFLVRVFTKLLLNFSWWVNRKDSTGSNVFEGGFLGMDNIGLFNRSAPLPPGYRLEQSDATSWMAFYCQQMFKIALELSRHDSAWDDVATKFLEHFLSIAQAMREFGSRGHLALARGGRLLLRRPGAAGRPGAAHAGAVDGRAAADPRRHRGAVVDRRRVPGRHRPAALAAAPAAGDDGAAAVPVRARAAAGCCCRWSTRTG